MTNPSTPAPPFVGVMSVAAAQHNSSIKALALIFDWIVVEDLASWLRVLWDEGTPGLPQAKELEWLVEHRVLRSVPSPHALNPWGPLGNRQTARLAYSTPELAEHWTKLLGSFDSMAKFSERLKALRKTSEYASLRRKLPRDFPGASSDEWDSNAVSLRLTAILLQQVRGIDAVALMPRPLFENLDVRDVRSSGPKRDTALKVVLNELPQPSPDTPWEAILELRQDSELRGKFLRLKTWLNRISRENLSQHEIRDAIAESLYAYGCHLAIHKLAITKGSLELIVTSAGELSEDFLKLKLGNLTQKLFFVKKQKIQLLEAEMKAPGKEIAFLFDLKEKLRHQS